MRAVNKKEISGNFMESTPSRRTLLKGVTGLTLGALGTSLFHGLEAFAASPDISHGPRNIKKVALTFHGAGGVNFADEILKITSEHNAPISVFAVGTFLEANPGMAQKIISQGHDLGNHTLTHTQMKTISPARVVSEIHGCATALTKEIGYAGKWFRPSGTQYSTALIRKKAALFGYPQCISYDVDSLDYQDPGSPTVISAVKKHVKPGSIISMHFGHKDTVQALPTILNYLKEKGLAPVTVTELLAPLGVTPSHRAVK